MVDTPAGKAQSHNNVYVFNFIICIVRRSVCPWGFSMNCAKCLSEMGYKVLTLTVLRAFVLCDLSGRKKKREIECVLCVCMCVCYYVLVCLFCFFFLGGGVVFLFFLVTFQNLLACWVCKNSETSSVQT